MCILIGKGSRYSIRHPPQRHPSRYSSHTSSITYVIHHIRHPSQRHSSHASYFHVLLISYELFYTEHRKHFFRVPIGSLGELEIAVKTLAIIEKKINNRKIAQHTYLT